MVQLVVFFWIASDLLRDEGLARKAFQTYALATSAVALGMLVGLTGLSVTYKTNVGARMSSMGFNPNTLSVIIVLAVLDTDGFVPHLASAAITGRSGSWPWPCLYFRLL